jgi:hypothetical protein
LVRWSVGPLVGPSVGLSLYHFDVIFSVICRRINLKFGGDFCIDLLFLFLLSFLLSPQPASAKSAKSAKSHEMGANIMQIGVLYFLAKKSQKSYFRQKVQYCTQDPQLLMAQTHKNFRHRQQKNSFLFFAMAYHVFYANHYSLFFDPKSNFEFLLWTVC